MPHLILDYTANLEGELDVALLFERVHQQLIDLQLFPPGGIRSRARRSEVFRFADGAEDDAGIHVELLLSGARPPQLRQQIGAVVFATICDHCAALQAHRYLALSMVVSTLEPTLFFNRNNLHARFEPRGINHGEKP